MSEKNSSEDFLNESIETLKARGKKRDDGKERAMQKIVKIFNAITDYNLSTEDGWKFMIALKLGRNERGADRDNIVDLIGYAALLGEEMFDEKE